MYLFMCSFHFHIFLGEVSFQIFCQFFDWVVWPVFVEYWIIYIDCKSFYEIHILQKKTFTALWLKSVFNRTEVFILNGAHSFFNWIVFVSFSKMSWLYYKASSSGGFYFVLLIYMCCLGYFGFIVSLEIKYCESFNFALLPQHCIDWSRTFCLPT